MDTQALRQRLHDRIYGRIVERWRRGELDDHEFAWAYRFRAQLFVPPIFVIPFLLAVIGDWIERDISVAEHFGRIGNFALMFGVFWLAIAAVIDGNARFGVRDMLLRRVRDQAERKQPSGVTRTQPVGDKQLGHAKLEVGRHTRTVVYWNRVLLRVVVGNALIVVLATLSPRAQWLLLITVPVLLWALIARFDRRPYLDLSPEGVWCRAWGKQRLPFADFKAVYPRQDRMGEQGVVLVPRAPAALASKLSWQGRLALRSGERVPAHAGTVTIWTSKVGLDRDSTLRALQAELSKGGQDVRVPGHEP